jgi:hypothetical protein
MRKLTTTTRKRTMKPKYKVVNGKLYIQRGDGVWDVVKAGAKGIYKFANTDIGKKVIGSALHALLGSGLSTAGRRATRIPQVPKGSGRRPKTRKTCKKKATKRR